jgi:hypothetical protein
MVHLPVIGAFLVLGHLFLAGAPRLLYQLPLYLFLGVYLGRDLALLCHYAPLLTIVCVAAALAALGFVKQIVTAADAIKTHIGLPPTGLAIGATLVLLATFATYVRWFANKP